DVANQPAVNVRIATHVCPSTPGNRFGGPIGAQAIHPVLVGPGYENNTAQMGDYFATRSFVDGALTPGEIQGAYGFETGGTPAPARLLEISDGLSNTLMLYESAGMPITYKGRTVVDCSASKNPNNCNRNWWGPWASYHSNRIYAWSFDG